MSEYDFYPNNDIELKDMIAFFESLDFVDVEDNPNVSVAYVYYMDILPYYNIDDEFEIGDHIYVIRGNPVFSPSKYIEVICY